MTLDRNCLVAPEENLTTWQHPKSKSIDYIIMKQRDSVDAAVRDSECNTDHLFLCTKLRMTWKWSKRVARKATRRFEVSGLSRVSRGEEEGLGDRRMCWRGLAEIGLRIHGTIEVMRSAMVDAAEKTLGTAVRRQPYWFMESEDIIRPCLQARNDAYTRWIASGLDV